MHQVKVPGAQRCQVHGGPPASWFGVNRYFLGYLYRVWHKGRTQYLFAERMNKCCTPLPVSITGERHTSLTLKICPPHR